MDNDSIVSRVYSNFRGADFRGDEINLIRSPDCLNVWKDYKETESIRTRPGMKIHHTYTGTVYGIYFYRGEMIVHAGDKLYNGETVLYEGLDAEPGNGFVYESDFYFKDKTHYICYNGQEVKDVVGYVPTTTIGRKPAGGGTKHEDVNMLSDYRKNSFLADGGSFEYYLDVKNIDTDYAPEVTYNDVVVSPDEYTVKYEEGCIEFLNAAPDAPLTDGQDNVIIKFKKHRPGYRETFLNCTLLQVFDNRVFFSGNSTYPNYVWHCSLDDPSYVSDLDYYKEGIDTAAVKGLVAGNNALWVFREPSSTNTTVFYHTPTLDEEYGKIYPSVHSSVTTGCVGKAINFNDDIVFFSERGMEGISGDVTTEQMAAHRSSLVDRKMTAEPEYKNMALAEWEGYLFVFCGNKAYLADSRAMFQNENHMEYEWFYFELDRNVVCTRVEKGVLYLGTDDGIYTLSGNGNVESYWTTPKDKFKYPHMMKTTSKKSCTVEATGKEILVYAKTNKDEDYELIGTFENVKDAFNCRIKKKKFKDIQLKFYSPKRFSLETATLESYIGGYLKNLS